MPQLFGAHAFCRFLRDLLTDFREILYRTFPSHVLTSEIFIRVFQKFDHLTCNKIPELV